MNTFELHKLVLSTARYTDWISKFVENIGKIHGKNIDMFYFDDKNLYIDMSFIDVPVEIMAESIKEMYIDAIESLILEGVINHIFFAADKGVALYANQLINVNRLAFRKMCEGTITIINFTIDTEHPKLRINFHN